MKKIESWDDIPTFATEDEEREFWERHEIGANLADDFDYPAKGPMARRLRETQEAFPDLDRETFERLVRLSLVEQTDPKALIFRFIRNGLREEELKTGLSSES